jgi:hypothetical protein
VSYEVRFAGDAEFDAIAALDGANFGFDYDAEALADARLDVDPERILVTTEAERIVAVSAELPMAMAMPGGGDVATTGLTWVSVDLIAAGGPTRTRHDASRRQPVGASGRCRDAAGNSALRRGCRVRGRRS